MGVSKHRGTPKWMIWGYHYFRKHAHRKSWKSTNTWSSIQIQKGVAMSCLLLSGETVRICWWFRRQVNLPVEGKGVEIPWFTGIYHHPRWLGMGFLNHQQYDLMMFFFEISSRKAGDFECLWTFAFEDGTLRLVLLWRCGRCWVLGGWW